jgi:hypothetical protein
MRMELAEVRGVLAELDSSLTEHPELLKGSLALVLQPYLKEMGRMRLASDRLREELQAAAIIEAKITESGWRGIGAALAAIFNHQNLLAVVGALMGTSLILGGAVAWNLGASNRLLLEHNRQATSECDRNLASDKDRNGWYTCPLWQLPMPKK